MHALHLLHVHRGSVPACESEGVETKIKVLHTVQSSDLNTGTMAMHRTGSWAGEQRLKYTIFGAIPFGPGAQWSGVYSAEAACS